MKTPDQGRPAGGDEDPKEQKKKEQALENSSYRETLSQATIRIFDPVEDFLAGGFASFDADDGDEFLDPEDLQGFLLGLHNQVEFNEDWRERKEHESDMCYMEAPELFEQAEMEIKVYTAILDILYGLEKHIVDMVDTPNIFVKQLRELFSETQALLLQKRMELFSQDEVAPRLDMRVDEYDVPSLGEEVKFPLN